MRKEHALACDLTKSEQQRRRAKKRQVKGAIAQLGEHLLCKQGVRGSIPRSSTMLAKSMYDLTKSNVLLSNLKAQLVVLIVNCLNDMFFYKLESQVIQTSNLVLTELLVSLILITLLIII